MRVGPRYPVDVGEPDFRQSLADPDAQSRPILVAVVDRDRIGQLRGHPAGRVQPGGRILRNIADPFAAHPGQRAFVDAGDLRVGDAGPSGDLHRP